MCFFPLGNAVGVNHIQLSRNSPQRNNFIHLKIVERAAKSSRTEQPSWNPEWNFSTSVQTFENNDASWKLQPLLIIVWSFHISMGKQTSGQRGDEIKTPLVYQPIRGTHGLHPTMLSSSYLCSILDPQAVSYPCSLILKMDTPTLTTVKGNDGALKVCYSAANVGLTSSKWIRSASHFEKLQCRMLWAGFSPIKLWYKHWRSDSAAFKRGTVSDSALDAPS